MQGQIKKLNKAEVYLRDNGKASAHGRFLSQYTHNKNLNEQLLSQMKSSGVMPEGNAATIAKSLGNGHHLSLPDFSAFGIEDQPAGSPNQQACQTARSGSQKRMQYTPKYHKELIVEKNTGEPGEAPLDAGTTALDQPPAKLAKEPSVNSGKINLAMKSKNYTDE